MDSEKLKKFFKEMPNNPTRDWMKQATYLVSNSLLTSEQRSQYEVLLAGLGSLISIREEEDKQLIEKVRKQVLTKMAKQMKQEGLDYPTISEITELSIEDIEQL